MMKKLSVLAIALACTAPALANDGFTGFAIGTEIDFISSDFNTESERITDANIVGSYAFAHNENLVSGFDAKVGVGSPRVANTTLNGDVAKVEQKVSASLAYRIGYTGFHDKVMPYVKASYEYIDLEASTPTASASRNLNGYGFGVGIKYMPVSHIELGAEYTHKKFDSTDFGIGSDFDSKSFAVGGQYRF